MLVAVLSHLLEAPAPFFFFFLFPHLLSVSFHTVYFCLKPNHSSMAACKAHSTSRNEQQLHKEALQWELKPEEIVLISSSVLLGRDHNECQHALLMGSGLLTQLVVTLYYWLDLNLESNLKWLATVTELMGSICQTLFNPSCSVFFSFLFCEPSQVALMPNLLIPVNKLCCFL